MNPDKFYQTYSAHGFYFPKPLLTTYCLSLFTKPFVILCGVSGTGKTKIAQLFPVAYEYFMGQDEAPSQVDIPGDWILLHLTQGVMTGDGRANFKYQNLTTLLAQQELNQLEPVRQKLISAGKDNNYSDLYDLIIETPRGTS